MLIFEDTKFIISLVIAVLSLVINIVQQLNTRRVKNKIGVWAKDAKSMASSIVGMQTNIKDKKISSLTDVTSHLETLSNFANSMYTSMAEEMGQIKRDITEDNK